MGRQALGLGEAGTAEAVPQENLNERWVRAKTARNAQRWLARCYYRGHDGVRVEIKRVGKTKRAALEALEQEVANRSEPGLDRVTSKTPLVVAGQRWLESISRQDGGLAPSTVRDYTYAYKRFIAAPGSTLRGLTLLQANDVQRLTAFLQGLADRHGSSFAKICKSVLTGILGAAVRNGILPSSAARQVGPIASETPGESVKDHTRAFTREQRDEVIAFADKQAANDSLNPRTKRKRESTALLIATLAALGLRIDEARHLRWERDIDLARGMVHVHVTKTKAGQRSLNAPQWLLERLYDRQRTSGGIGLLFPAPAHVNAPELLWDQSNSAKAVAATLKAAGYEWAIPHTFRRTVATLLHEAGIPLVKISDWLGHADPAMTARIYFGRDFTGDKGELGALL